MGVGPKEGAMSTNDVESRAATDRKTYLTPVESGGNRPPEGLSCEESVCGRVESHGGKGAVGGRK